MDALGHVVEDEAVGGPAERLETRTLRHLDIPDVVRRDLEREPPRRRRAVEPPPVRRPRSRAPRLRPSEIQEKLLKLLLAISEGRGDDAADVAIALGERSDGFSEGSMRRAVAPTPV